MTTDQTGWMYVTEDGTYGDLRTIRALPVGQIDVDELSDGDIAAYAAQHGQSWNPESPAPVDEEPRVPVYRYLDLSTSHLSQQEVNEVGTAPGRAIPHEYGAWVHVPSVAEEEFESDFVGAYADMWEAYPNLLLAIRYARTLGDDVFWINFDADGDQVEALPTYSW